MSWIQCLLACLGLLYHIETRNLHSASSSDPILLYTLVLPEHPMDRSLGMPCFISFFQEFPICHGVDSGPDADGRCPCSLNVLPPTTFACCPGEVGKDCALTF